jgi:hypothetical protein
MARETRPVGGPFSGGEEVVARKTRPMKEGLGLVRREGRRTVGYVTDCPEIPHNAAKETRMVREAMTAGWMAAAHSQLPRSASRFQSVVDSQPCAVRRHGIASDATFESPKGVALAGFDVARIFLNKKPWVGRFVSSASASSG